MTPRPGSHSIFTRVPGPSAGADGPVLPHDTYLVEQMARFSPERLPERSVPVKGTGIRRLRNHRATSVRTDLAVPVQVR
jgi:catalase